MRVPGTHPVNLLTKEARSSLPPLYSTEDTPTENKIVRVKFFTPDSNWTWYAVEADDEGSDVRFFGLVDGFEREWGYFMLDELAAVRGPLGLPIERDRYFTPTKAGEL